MAKRGFFDDQDEKRFEELEKELERLDFTEEDKRRLSELEQEMKQFELSLLDSDLAFLLR